MLQVSIPFNASTKINSGFVSNPFIASVTPFFVALRILSSSISCLSIIATDQLKAFSIIKGDAKCYSISAASILAKVTRDRIMREWDEIYPQYGFAKNKGYGTKMHIEALKEYGPCPIHRKTFIKHFVD